MKALITFLALVLVTTASAHTEETEASGSRRPSGRYEDSTSRPYISCDEQTDQPQRAISVQPRKVYYVKISQSEGKWGPGGVTDKCAWIFVRSGGEAPFKLEPGTRLPGSVVGRDREECVTLFPPYVDELGHKNYWNFLGCGRNSEIRYTDTDGILWERKPPRRVQDSDL